MEFSIKEIQRKTKEALLKDKQLQDYYLDLYEVINKNASKGNYSIYYKPKDDYFDKLVTLFKIDGFDVVTSIPFLITISWR